MKNMTNLNMENENEKQVQKIMAEIKKHSSENIIHKENENVENIVKGDISQQKENFKQRLEEKRKRTLLSTSDITDAIETIKNKRIEKSPNNKSFIIDSNKIMHLQETDTTSQNNLPVDEVINNDSSVNNNILNILDSSFENQNRFPLNKLDEIDDSYSPKLHTSKSITNMNSSRDHTHHSSVFKKNKPVFSDIKSNLDSFLMEFNFYFFEEVFQQVAEEIEKVLEEKQEKSLEISKNYNGQIKEMEFLLTGGSV
jgi:hypothetical protein